MGILEIVSIWIDIKIKIYSINNNIYILIYILIHNNEENYKKIEISL